MRWAPLAADGAGITAFRGILSHQRPSRVSFVVRQAEGESMALRKRGKWRYGDSQADIRDEILRYSKREYPSHYYADAVCKCGGRAVSPSDG